MAEKVNFRKIIQKKLDKKQMSVPKLARLVELNPQTLYNYMAGRSQLTAGNLEEIFVTLNIKVK